MRHAIRHFPWFEVILIVGLAVALIVKPQTKVFSATPADGAPSVAGGVASVLPH